MKEASGELSMTAVAVVAIAAVGVLFTTLIWPSIKSGITASTRCSQAFNCQPEGTSGKVKCEYCKDDDCSTTGTVYCDDKTTNSGTGTGTGTIIFSK